MGPAPPFRSLHGTASDGALTAGRDSGSSITEVRLLPEEAEAP